MKHLKRFKEKKPEYLKKGDIVKVTKRITSRPDWKIGDLLVIMDVDQNDINKNLPYEVVPINTPKERYYSRAIWATLDEVEKATEKDIYEQELRNSQMKYNL